MTVAQSPGVPFAPDFQVADWLVEPSLNRLSRNGSLSRMRPQLINLLVVLARHAGRTVSKEEILSSVWEGQFIAESAISRCIAELRRSLEDDARRPRVLETIPKRGYRLVAPVVFLEQGGPAGAPRSPAAAPVARDTRPGQPAELRAWRQRLRIRRRVVAAAALAAWTKVLGAIETAAARLRRKLDLGGTA